MSKDRGLFITFEGIDGCGKSTQARKLHEYFVSKGLPVILTREPGGKNVKISESIRNILLSPANKTMDWKTELLLFMASRSQHVEEFIRPKLTQGITVICDRFADASLAYQGYGRELPLDVIAYLNKFSMSGCTPDKTFVFDIDYQEFEERKEKINGKLDRIETSGKVFLEKVRNGYIQLVRGEPDRFVLLDGSKPIEVLSEKVVETIIPFIKAASADES